MANKNITMRQLNNDGVYEKLYPQTSATQSKVSEAAQKIINQDNVDGYLSTLFDLLGAINNTTVQVLSVDGNPIQGAKVSGFDIGSTETNEDGEASGVLTSNSISITSPYADMKDAVVNVSDMENDTSEIVATLQSVSENEVVQYSSSEILRFSNRVNTVDVTCVGSGGEDEETSTGVEVSPETDYSVIIGAGESNSNTSFMGVSATGNEGSSGVVKVCYHLKTNNEVTT